MEQKELAAVAKSHTKTMVALLAFLCLGLAAEIAGRVFGIGILKVAVDLEHEQLRSGGDLVAWLSMGEADMYHTLRARFQNVTGARFLYHSYDQPCVNNECIFKPKTSFAEGCHLLLKEALKEPRVKYFVLFDDDIDLYCGEGLKAAILSGKKNHVSSSNKCWASFTSMLLEPNTTYPFIKPLDDRVDKADAHTLKYQSCCDENFKAFHRDYHWFFYPLSYRYKTSAGISMVGQRCTCP